jgi:dTMP kinase
VSDVKFIVVDGIEGAGKTTVCAYLKKKFEEDRRPVELIRALGTGPVGKLIREIYTKDRKSLTNLERSLTIAASIIEAHGEAKRLVAEGTHVICDRWVSTFYAYQCTALQYPLADMVFQEALINPEHLDLVPDRALYLNTPPEVCAERINARSTQERNWLDDGTLDFFRKLIDGYRVYYENFNRSYPVIVNGDQPLEAVEAKLDTFYTILFEV